jgi:hypothetical protein
MIPVVKMVIQCITSQSWTHLLHASCQGIGVCSPTLWSLAVCLSNVRCKVEKELEITSLNMGRKAKFQDKEGKFFSAVNCKGGVLVGKQLIPEIDMPLTHNIVRDKNGNSGEWLMLRKNM